MAKVPYQSIGQIWAKEIGFWKSYEKEEKIFLYEFEILDHGITGKYFYDFHTSVWIMNEQEYKKFAETYKVISGGWYGHNQEGKWVGGRWNALKRTFGEILFQGVTNFVQQKNTSNTLSKFAIKKPNLTNRFKMEICNNKIESMMFDCDNITFNPSNRIFLLHREKNLFVDATDLLKDDGFTLIEQ